MPITIDKAGRVVIPADLRRRAGLTPGTPIAVSFENGAIHLSRDVPPPQIEKRGNRLIARPTRPSTKGIDIAAQVEEERNRWPG
ncbi:AbrB/MazE/SpoVT family DNA-binding domain-containing protein [Coraliomargarita parva]|uniref:AbrB/MazE/SpoVT family DNA-binding domain-containing protein n=1 Tax=Coraliomargarita parva TaxID=3014050 RepID=UPI0022B3D885|nr:AbrB/MazE/SpoVT family DNA-binding domain-containing protein [Coraliomargarita parva]